VKHAVRFRVSGKVQGVGFRAYTRRTALEFGVNGWVRNLPDGSVTGEAEGQPRPLETFLRAVMRGPSMARVASFQRDRIDPKGHVGFSIR